MVTVSRRMVLNMQRDIPMLACKVLRGISQSIGGVAACFTVVFALLAFFVRADTGAGGPCCSATWVRTGEGSRAFDLSVRLVFFSDTATGTAASSLKLDELLEMLLGPVDPDNAFDPALGILALRFFFEFGACTGGGDGDDSFGESAANLFDDVYVDGRVIVMVIGKGPDGSW